MGSVPIHMLRMRWNLRMSSLPASRATPTPNATTPSAVATMCFIVRAFLYLPGRAFPAQILSVRSESRPLMFISQAGSRLQSAIGSKAGPTTD